MLTAGCAASCALSTPRAGQTITARFEQQRSTATAKPSLVKARASSLETRQAKQAASPRNSKVAAAPPKSGAAEAAPPKPACRTGEWEQRYHGFYQDDPFPRGEVVLTFDDGPHPTLTPKVLDLLAEHRVPATFFVVGAAIRRTTYPLIQRMVREGHSLGTHSYNHDVGMAKRGTSERSRGYIRGQHEVTQILIDLALLATSAKEFDELFVRVFQKKAGLYMPASSLRREREAFARRHRAVLASQGYALGSRPYPVLYSRPPAGTPFVGLSDAAHKNLYSSALEELGLVNVMWHGESGDTHPKRKRDFAFLHRNLRRHSARGGILLIHDYMRSDVLRLTLKQITANPDISVVPLERAVLRKFGCSSRELAKALQPGRAAG